MSESCSNTHALTPFQLGLGWFLLVGTALSFVPVEAKILLSHSSAGISVGNIFVFLVQAFSALGSSLVLLWQSRIGCCFWREPRWSKATCLNNLIIPMQYGAMVLSYLLIFSLYLVFHTRRRNHPKVVDEAAAPLLHKITLVPDPHAGIQQHPLDHRAPPVALQNSETFRLACVMFCLALGFIGALIGGAVVLGNYAGVESRAFRDYGFALGIISALGQCAGNAPQIVETYRQGAVGSQSLVTQFLQVPGGVLIALFQMQAAPDEVFVWLALWVGAVLQCLLFGMLLFFAVKGYLMNRGKPDYKFNLKHWL